MTGFRTSTIALLVAGGGALLFVASASFLALLLHHRALAGDYTDTYFLVPFWLPVTFLVCSVLVLFGSLTIRHGGKCQSYVVRRLALAGTLLTAAAWTMCGLSWLIAGA